MSAELDRIVTGLDRERPVLVAGPTASGKSALAMRIAERGGGRIVNADALQVFADWRVLTARPSPQDEARVPHALYGHVPGDRAYSVGEWLRQATPLVGVTPRPIFVGGTGLYFAALTEGLAEIPPTPPAIRQEADARLATRGIDALLGDIDQETQSRIDTRNPARVQRAWEVLQSTGRSLAAWQAETGPPVLGPGAAQRILLTPDRDRLAARIERRTDRMLSEGAIEEARRNAAGWHNLLPSAKAIGATELIAHVRGQMAQEAVRTAIAVQTRQYAKRQRTWFRARMGDWTSIDPAGFRDP